MCQYKFTHTRRVAIQTVTLSIFRYRPVSNRIWMFGQMALARFALPKVPGIKFWKLCGSGTGEGFTPVPNTAVWAVLCTWDSVEDAQAGLQAPVFKRFHDRADEAYTLYLNPMSARGVWSGEEPFEATEADTGPIAALTRATVKLHKAPRFWARVGNISRMIGSDENVMFKIGIGEVPLLHQVTFSVWPDTTTMADFARRNGPHADAIRAVREGDWFAEELYARFRVIHTTGTWEGISPIPNTEVAA